MMKTLRCACVDIGSNTTRLLVAEASAAGLAEVAAERRFVRLRRGPADAGRAPALAAVVGAHAARARALGAETLRVVATAALRTAPDQSVLVAAAERAAGVPVEILSPEEEARLAFAGAVASLDSPPTGTIGVADVGGGSSELIVGTARAGVSWIASIDLGSGVLADRHLRSDPPEAGELAAVRAEAEAALASVSPPPCDAAFALGGSATSLRLLVGDEVSPSSLDAALEALTALPVAEAAERYGLHAERVRLLPAGLLLLRAAAAALGRPLRIARGGLREGVLLQEFGSRHPAPPPRS